MKHIGDTIKTICIRVALSVDGKESKSRLFQLLDEGLINDIEFTHLIKTNDLEHT